MLKVGCVGMALGSARSHKQLPDPPMGERPGLTPARRQWLAWHLISGKFAQWASEAANPHPTNTTAVLSARGLLWLYLLCVLVINIIY